MCDRWQEGGAWLQRQLLPSSWPRQQQGSKCALFPPVAPLLPPQVPAPARDTMRSQDILSSMARRAVASLATLKSVTALLACVKHHHAPAATAAGAEPMAADATAAGEGAGEEQEGNIAAATEAGPEPEVVVPRMPTATGFMPHW